MRLVSPQLDKFWAPQRRRTRCMQTKQYIKDHQEILAGANK